MDKKKKITLERVDQQLYLKYSRSSLVDLGSLDSRQILNMSKADCQRIHKELKRLIVDMTSHPFSSVMPSGEVHPFLQCRMIPPAGIEELATHAEQRFKRKLQIYILELQVMSGSQREFQDARAQLNKININNNWITQLSNRRTALGL